MKGRPKKEDTQKKNVSKSQISIDLVSGVKCNPEAYFRYEISSFILKPGLPISLSESLSSLINTLAEKLTLDNLRTFQTTRYYTLIFNNSICESLQQSYLGILSNEKYSLAIDTANSQGNEEYLAINARYFATEDSLTTSTTFLGLLPLKASFSGETIFTILNNFLFTGDEGYARKKNLLGISTDGASNMISKGAAGVTNRMSNDLPHLVVLHDLCHAFNLVIKNCPNTFPKVYRDNIANISSIFAHSAKKSAKFKELLKGKGEHILAIKRFVPTRWKSLYECLDCTRL